MLSGPNRLVVGICVAAALVCGAEWFSAQTLIPGVRWVPAEMPQMLAITAGLLLADAIALAFTAFRRRRAGAILAGLAAIVNVLVLARGVVGPVAAARTLLWDIASPSPDTAGVGVVLALAILLVATARRPFTRVGHVLGLVALGFATFVLVAHLFSARRLYTMTGAEVAMSPITGVVVVALGFAALSVSPRQGLMRILYRQTEGGRLARQFLPVVFGGPLLIASLVAYGLRHGLYTYHAEIALLVVAVMFTLGAAAWRHAVNVDAAEARLERIVLERTRRLMETIDEIEDFSQALAHDFRGPLINLREFLGLVLHDHGHELSPGVRDYLERASRAGRRLDRLTSAMLRYTELSGRPFQLRRVDSSALAHAMAEGSRRGACAGAAVAVEGEWPDVWADEDALRDVFDELLTNACRFARPGEWPRVTLSAHVMATHVRLLVRDEGVGVAAEHQDRIFRPFERLVRSDEHPGIGLALVRRAVTKMNGRVGVVSDGKNGSTFWVDLPLPSDGSPTRETPRPVPAAGIAPPQPA